MKRDVYQSITDQIVSELEKGVRPWQKPWNASHMDGRVVLPLRHNGVAYRGCSLNWPVIQIGTLYPLAVNIITLWMAAMGVWLLGLYPLVSHASADRLKSVGSRFRTEQTSDSDSVSPRRQPLPWRVAPKSNSRRRDPRKTDRR
jgi:N-terminal domain of anti-restriction factor ArdC